MVSLWYLFIFFALAALAPVFAYIKQTVFQGRAFALTDILNPLTYLKNPIFGLQVFLVAGLAFLAFLLEGYLRQHFKLTEVYAWSSLVTIPISLVVTLGTFALSEKYLLDKINWQGAIIWAIGLAVTGYGATILLKLQ